MFGDFFLHFWLQRPNEDNAMKNKTKMIRQLGLGHLWFHNPTRRCSLPSGPGGGFNRAARSPQGRAQVQARQIDKRKSKSVSRKMTSDYRPKKAPKTAPTNRKLAPRWPKMAPGAPQNGPKRGRRWSKKRPQTARRKKNRTKTIPRPSWTAPGPISIAQPPPPGSIWEAKSAPKSTPKRSKIEAKNQESKKTIQDDLGPVLGRSWAVSGAILGPWKRSGTTPADVS